MFMSVVMWCISNLAFIKLLFIEELSASIIELKLSRLPLVDWLVFCLEISFIFFDLPFFL